MFLILKLILIILINKTYTYITQDSEIILLPVWNTTEAKEISLTFKSFGKLMQLNLRRNNQVVSSAFKLWKNNEKLVTEKLSKLKTSECCFYFYKNYVSFAVINICQEHGLEGLLFVENDVLEIQPLQNVLAPSSFINDYCVKEQINQSIGKLHLIKRSLQYLAGLDFYHAHKITKRSYVNETLEKQEQFVIELAIFVDAAAYKRLMKLLYNDFKNVFNWMLVYVNLIQTLFYHPSLGVQIDISLVRLDFMEKQPSTLPTYDGDMYKMFDSFCSYAKNINPRRDIDPRHWDIALYITGLNIVNVTSDGYRYYGCAKHNEICSQSLSCAIVNFFVEKLTVTSLKRSLHNKWRYFDKSDGFSRLNRMAEQAAVISAHEIGHLLGLQHDSGEEICGKKRIYIMCQAPAPYRGVKWSPFSRERIKIVLEDKWCLRDYTKLQDIRYYDHYAFDNSTCHDYPGKKKTAKAQCESYLHDKDANVVTLHDICKNLECETPHRNNSYFAGRALNGTYCALGKECCNGQCVPVTEPPYNFKYCEKDKWSEWKDGFCKSSCLEKSKGARIKRRFCEHRNRRTANCTGPYYDMDLCDDSLLCTKKRLTIAEFTTIKCFEFRKFANMSKLLIASGNQMPHDVEKPWLACTVFCRHKDISTWYALRKEMFNCCTDPYFPDGTWCHNKDGQDYFCRQHLCLPENYSFAKSEECKNNC